MRLVFRVDGEPKGKPRATHSIKTHTDYYKQSWYRPYKALIRQRLREAMEKEGVAELPAGSDYFIRLVAHHKPAGSWSRRKQARAISGEIPCHKLPDNDNLEKMFFDAIWEQDSGVTANFTSKKWDYDNYVEVTIEELKRYDNG